ncbi:hypothetical protein H696_04586 [Fonticula alba]|uniref:HIG1 domain-containing protein n=1 Tax=Fonticula alba TaxID=691883 RepID=A0A058Z6L3_FONAL|nr:hypothetical protein H696_04586 [Fonticula alba]KCV69172.1 hypothetical protein H696_04586 [Fonticula alba]|eukprot:XP_009496743.1 hypothetical protein H696_04586 [Fonticula alba]
MKAGGKAPFWASDFSQRAIRSPLAAFLAAGTLTFLLLRQIRLGRQDRDQRLMATIYQRESPVPAAPGALPPPSDIPPSE